MSSCFLAHPVHDELSVGEVLGHVTLDPTAVLPIVIGGTVYGVGLWRLWRTVGVGHGVRRIEALAYALGLLSLAVALLSPLDFLSDLSFAAHMSQHEILMLVGAPLIVLGRPWIPLLHVTSAGVRARVMPAFRSRAWTRTIRIALHPITVLFVHGAVLWAWHLPSLFEAAMKDERVHTVQHLMFFLTAVAFWWALLYGRFGRAGYGVGVLFVFATAVHTSLLGVIIAFAKHVLYPTYLGRTVVLGLDALDDQQTAGLVMWVPAGVFFLFAGLAMSAAWIGESRRRALRAELLEQGGSS
jgi:putative membrane protein